MKLIFDGEEVYLRVGAKARGMQRCGRRPHGVALSYQDFRLLLSMPQQKMADYLHHLSLALSDLPGEFPQSLP